MELGREMVAAIGDEVHLCGLWPEKARTERFCG